METFTFDDQRIMDARQKHQTMLIPSNFFFTKSILAFSPCAFKSPLNQIIYEGKQISVPTIEPYEPVRRRCKKIV